MAKEKIDGSQYVSCDEVKAYLTELSKCLQQVTDGITQSMEAMDKKLEQGESDDDKE